jgi:hypothetical protein
MGHPYCTHTKRRFNLQLDKTVRLPINGSQEIQKEIQSGTGRMNRDEKRRMKGSMNIVCDATFFRA